ncbi:hypothetical protein K490DRAFT_56831 [Saccharata proteae CBS 121410]|uniref:Uncharacterized protein n=1 Tax=Saccharata proteae CBS 121410 TaxID=1314787 RepID=A0A9P4HWI2_9PEZI|nr:hypothetical protein K490DRAFT_56831 [Saccharata proteae CBS 121410]
MGINYYASSSPTVVLPPQHPPSYFDASLNPSRFNASPGQHAFSAKTPRIPAPPSLNYQAASSNSIAGRKRSLDDIGTDETPLDGSKNIMKPKPEPVMGPGMTLIYPGEPGFSLAAESQTGTWAEEKNEHHEVNKPTERPIASTRKSQRRDGVAQASSSPPAVQPVLASDEVPSLDTKSLAFKAVNMPIDNVGHTVNDLTIALGIGWKEIVFNSTKKDAARGWAKYISRHYPLSCPQVLYESEAHDAYLVYARDVADGCEKYFAFKQDLKSCRLVSQTLEGAVRNLTQHPIVYESAVVTARDASPPPERNSGIAVNGDMDMSIDQPAVAVQPHTDDVAMQM